MDRPHWRLIVTPPATGAENMAVDEALMEHTRATDEWVLRVYSWSVPTVSFGRNQTAAGRYDLREIRTRGYGVVRRPTGGRAILHDREITYCITAPVAAAGDLRQSYDRINHVVLDGLRRLGVGAVIARPTARSASPGIAPCFHEPSAGELTLDGRKLAGSAQWRSEGVLLQHGSILVVDDQSVLAELTIPRQNAIPAPATLREALGHAPSVEEVAAALAESVRALELTAPVPLAADDQLRARADALVVRYLDDAWTWWR
ncbi:MAG TPA: lipoate--protein ligase family protein [Gemmatimonadaceae bacterium]|nr:lipoate--protein ligase family protein [Gemmatimonadaceae bacterium]